MAVQAQYPSNAFSPEILNRARKSALDDLQMMPDHPNLLLLHDSLDLGVAGKQHLQILNNATVFSDPHSELTCNASGSRKRAREESMAPPSCHNPALAPVFPGPNLAAASVKPTGANNISGVLQQSRMIESTATSTSDRLASSPQVAAPLSRDLVSLLYQQNLEIDALVRLQTETLRTGLEEARKRHCRAVLSAWEQQVAKRLMEKEAELEIARRRNAELEEKLRQMCEENQIWYSMAKNNESIVCSLRASLEQALLQNAAEGGREGYGDSDSPLPIDDAQSCGFEVEQVGTADAAEVARRWKACKVCGERDVCVLLLPCRHLCLCKDCEPEAGGCPVCGSAKNACLQVFMC